jgi:hypothetical protein
MNVSFIAVVTSVLNGVESKQNIAVTLPNDIAASLVSAIGVNDTQAEQIGKLGDAIVEMGTKLDAETTLTAKDFQSSAEATLAA